MCACDNLSPWYSMNCVRKWWLITLVRYELCVRVITYHPGTVWIMCAGDNLSPCYRMNFVWVITYHPGTVWIMCGLLPITLVQYEICVLVVTYHPGTVWIMWSKSKKIPGCNNLYFRKCTLLTYLVPDWIWWGWDSRCCCQGCAARVVQSPMKTSRNWNDGVIVYLLCVYGCTCLYIYIYIYCLIERVQLKSCMRPWIDSLEFTTKRKYFKWFTNSRKITLETTKTHHNESKRPASILKAPMNTVLLPWNHGRIHILSWTLSTEMVIIRACACWALFVATLTTTIHYTSYILYVMMDVRHVIQMWLRWHYWSICFCSQMIHQWSMTQYTQYMALCCDHLLISNEN